MPHTDGPLYHPYVTVISIGSPILFKIFKDMDDFAAENELGNIIVESGSLLVFSSVYYHDYLHAIQDCAYETVKVEYRIVNGVSSSKDQLHDATKISLQRQNSSIQNLELSRLYLEHLVALETRKFNGLAEISDFVLKIGTEAGEFKFEHILKPEEQQFLLFVVWKRDRRISITIRHVPVKVPDYPEDPTLQS